MGVSVVLEGSGTGDNPCTPFLGNPAPGTSEGCWPTSDRCPSWVSEPYDISGQDVAGDSDQANSEIIEISPGGDTVYVVGSSSGNAGGEITMVAVAVGGSLRWAKSYAAQGYGIAQALALHPDGHALFASGYHYDDFESCRGVVFARDAATGQEIWTQQQALDEKCWIPQDLVVDESRNLVLSVGEVSLLTDHVGSQVVAFDATTGERLWVHRLDLGLRGVEDAAFARRIRLGADGNTMYLAGGWSSPHAGTRYYDGRSLSVWAFRYSREGVEQTWEMTQDLGSSNIAAGITENPSGKLVFVTGVDQSSGWDRTMTLGLDAATGDVLWRRSIPNSDVWAMGPIAFARGRVYIATKSWVEDPDGDMRYEVRAYRGSSGRRVWTTRYRTPHQKIASQTRISGFVTFPAIVSSTDGTALYLMGTGFRATEVLRLRSKTGAREWFGAYTGSDRSWPAGIAVAEGSGPYLGTCLYRENSGTYCDLQIVAYDP